MEFKYHPSIAQALDNNMKETGLPSNWLECAAELFSLFLTLSVFMLQRVKAMFTLRRTQGLCCET
jgi:hypothetical protein